MSGTTYGQATETARQYYNSDDADAFYAQVWGGEDIHVGLYESEDDPIRTASRRTVEAMADRIGPLDESSVVLDIGCGYGGAARYLAKRFGCRVIGLNLSEAENRRHREMNAEAGLQDRIEVIDGSFEAIPLDDASVDVVWSQDAILHSGDRVKVLQEVDRVLRCNGRFVMTDPMQSDDCPEGVLDPILSRIHLTDLGSPGFYQSTAESLGWKDLGFQPMTEQLARHYARVLATTEAEGERLKESISPDYLTRMKAGLRHWIDGGKAGHLAWGIFLFQKPVSS
ncbi:methyltransferase domain-containing protein [Crateriforma conspicua]|uniref:Sarcosine/dimethylglycine N-methyltransferase n=1 Tax=Crateriforma conspicua TaxID=2527996 RepID=A0A5C5Y7G6_9PLAN|nr:methyltransferase domain-containing protein [Crateriforma conspicua]TWT71124.1 Sarcosine/dimethylglycine N-methyltransferase [Crateriforma conspicua]